MDDLHALQNRVPADMIAAFFQAASADKVHFAAKNPFQLILHADHVEKGWPGLVVESDQDVDIAFGPEILAQHGPEKRQFRHSPFQAKGVHRLAVQGNSEIFRERPAGRIMPPAFALGGIDGAGAHSSSIFEKVYEDHGLNTRIFWIADEKRAGTGACPYGWAVWRRIVPWGQAV
jgi:hypothetical protein